MSKANNSRRKKLLVNIFHSDLSAADKMTFYAMAYKYIDGEQLLDFIQRQNPTQMQIVDYVEEKIRKKNLNQKFLSRQQKLLKRLR